MGGPTAVGPMAGQGCGELGTTIPQGGWGRDWADVGSWAMGRVGGGPGEDSWCPQGPEKFVLQRVRFPSWA